MSKKKDYGIDSLFVLNGDRYFIDDKGEFEAIFKVSKVTESPKIPHGIKYTLLLLNAKGERVVCFDNAHAVNKGSGPGKTRSNNMTIYTLETGLFLMNSKMHLRCSKILGMRSINRFSGISDRRDN